MNKLQALVSQVANILSHLNYKLVSAESCTGGWVAKTCTDLPGSSAWFDRGFVTYSNEAKQSELDVKESTLIAHGAVSQETVEEMALGAIKHSKADVSVAITGIAGPEGGSTLKPVGTVWIGWANKKNEVTSHLFHFKGDRNDVRCQAVYQALSGIIKNARDN